LLVQVTVVPAVISIRLGWKARLLMPALIEALLAAREVSPAAVTPAAGGGGPGCCRARHLAAWRCWCWWPEATGCGASPGLPAAGRRSRPPFRPGVSRAG